MRSLRVRATEHDRSPEEEAREILRRLVGKAAPPRNFAVAIRARGARVPLAGNTNAGRLLSTRSQSMLHA